MDLEVRISEKGYCYDGNNRRIPSKAYLQILENNIDHISENITEYLDYPYLRYYVTEDQIIACYEDLKYDKLDDFIVNFDMSVQNTILKKKSRLIMKRAFFTGYKYEKLMEYFQEDSRRKCNREGHPSPLQTFIEPQYNKVWIRKYYKEILDKKDINLEIKREMSIIYKKYCDPFPANMSLWLFNKWKPKRILMMSGAWGDEIISTMAYGDHEFLTAVDPNSEAVKNWDKMVDFYDPENKHKYKFHIQPFEDVVLSKEEKDYDMMYSSPPYFSAEHYSDDKDQSYLKFGTVDQWLDGFLRPSLVKVWKLMRKEGVVVLALNDAVINGKNIRLVQPMHDIMDGLKGSQFIGTYGFKKMKQQKNFQPLFCWKKTI